MKKIPLLIIMAFAALIAALMYADHPQYDYRCLGRKAKKYQKTMGKHVNHWCGKLGNCQDAVYHTFEKIQDKMPF